jgi:hypothetical protein
MTKEIRSARAMGPGDWDWYVLNADSHTPQQHIPRKACQTFKPTAWPTGREASKQNSNSCRGRCMEKSPYEHPTSDDSAAWPWPACRYFEDAQT